MTRRRPELVWLLAVGGVAASLWGAAELTDAVLEGETSSIDRALLIAMREPSDLADPRGPRWFEEMARDVTALGSAIVLVCTSLVAAIQLALRRAHRTVMFLVVAIGGGLLCSHALKAVFMRPRPDLVVHHQQVFTTSFPSGHAMMAALTYLTLGVLLAGIESRRRLKTFWLAVAVVLTLAVGVSRVYLGVHWPTDVLAGWTFGWAWALACWVVLRVLQRRGTTETQVEA